MKYSAMGTAVLAVLMLGGNGNGAPKKADKYGACTIPIVLKGTVVAEGKPEWSQAQVDDPSTKNSRTFTLKRPWVQSGARIVEIGEGFVTLEVGKEKALQRCYTEAHVFSAPEKTSSIRSKTVSTAVSGPKGDTPKWKLKDAIDVLASFPRSGNREAQKVPGFWNWSAQALNGESFQVFQITKKSPLWDLGIRPYDVVMGLNGKKFDTPDKAGKIFEGLADNTEKLVFEVKRRGKVVKFEYNP